MEILDLREVCKLLHIAVQTGRNRLMKNENSMPPSFRPIGTRRRLFLVSEVERWLANQAGVQRDTTSHSSEKRGPGRPRKVRTNQSGFS
jgi:predicted DNA-binding transcriptional regulator AlpA